MATHRCTCGHIHAELKQPAPYGNCGSCGEALPQPVAGAHSCAITPDYSRNWTDFSFGHLDDEPPPYVPPPARPGGTTRL
jgi:hypothetical protein